MELKEGMYVRTRWGCIAKFEGIHEGFYEFDNIIMDESSGVREELFVDIVEKSSPNIIDLIEVGDYVNGCPVLHKENNELVCGLLLRYKEENIQDVVTKEQFESIEYRIGE